MAPGEGPFRGAHPIPSFSGTRRHTGRGRGSELRGWWRLALIAGAVAAGGIGAADEVCELSRVDRASTDSYLCMSCHDGSAGKVVPFTMGPGGMIHSVTVDYATAAASHPGTYVPAADLPKDVPLVNGKVECTSCHNWSQPAPSRVVDPLRLCYACHLK